MLAALAAWLSGLSLSVLALIAAITAFLGWRRSSLFREEFPSLSIELTREHIYADGEWTLLVLTARLKNTSRVLVKIDAVSWTLGVFVPGTAETIELYASPEHSTPFPDFYLEPQGESAVFAEIWLSSPESSQPAFAETVVHCPSMRNISPIVCSRRIHFLLEEYRA